MTRVLIVSSSYPPFAGGGVRRVAAFAKHLRRLGFDVDTLSGEGDPSVRYRSIADGLKGVAATLRLGLVYRGATAMFAIPDAKVLDLPAILVPRIARPDVIIASSPPPSIQVAAAVLARRYDCPLIADLRDPWSDHPRLVAPTALHRWLQQKVEQGVLGRAGAIVTATAAMKRMIANRIDVPVETICNGYDPDLFAGAEPVRASLIGFYGSIYNPIDPAPMVRAVAASGATLEFAGHDYDQALSRASARYGLRTSFLGHLSPLEVARHMMGAGVLMLILPADPSWSYVRTQKLPEYLASGRPILAMVPEGEAADLVRANCAGTVLRPTDWEGAASAIPELGGRFSRSEPPLELMWETQVRRLGQLIKKII
jgi:glycosyltransferase involved in cell wall biosynthesis